MRGSSEVLRVLSALAAATLFNRGLVACGGDSVDPSSGDDGTGGTAGTNEAGDGGNSVGGSSGRGGSTTGGRGGSGAGTTGGHGGTAGGEGGISGAGGESGGGSDGCLDGPPLELDPSPVRRPWVDAAAEHTCFLRRNGTVACWGANDREWAHQTWSQRLAVPPNGTFIRLESGLRSCALEADGNAVCWGDSSEFDFPEPNESYADLSLLSATWCALRTNGTLDCDRYPPYEQPAGTYVAVTGSTGAACALARTGAVTCWGQMPDAPCGPFLEVSAGEAHACGLRVDGTIACWGEDSLGQASPPAGVFSQISAGNRHNCALRSDGSVACWGAPDGIDAPSGTFVQVSAGLSHSCALRSDDKVLCWGKGDKFELDPTWDIAAEDSTYTRISVAGASDLGHEEGDDVTFDTNACGVRPDGSIDCWGAVAEPPNGPFVDIFVGTRAGCALDAGGTLTCFPIAGSAGVSAPAEGFLTGTFDSVSFGLMLACALRTDGELVCWNGGYDIPEAAPEGPFTAVSVSDSVYLPGHDPRGLHQHVCALRADGRAHCWNYSSEPSERLVEGPFVEVSAGYRRDCARRADGSAVCWVDNATSELEPVAGTFTKIGTMRSYFMALRADGTVHGFGPDDTFVDISVAEDFACGLRTDGHVRCWGSRVR